MEQDTSMSVVPSHEKIYARTWFWVVCVLVAGVVGYAGLVFANVVPGPYRLVIIELTGCDPGDEMYDICIGLGSGGVRKPVIYLYPETTTDVTVNLDYDGTLIADYPPYDESIGGWEVIAQPDGTLTNHADGKEYSYLFWEGTPASPVNWDLSTGFIVPGSDTREFLQEKLAEIGLTPKEYNEFIVYWYPKMKENPYNLIHFAGTEYTDTAPLTITPKPDNTLRVFMVYKPLARPVDVTPQTFTPFTRTGFTVVEWGGTEVRR